MTTLRQIQLTCPICSNTFNSQAVLSTNSFGGKRTDFHERAVGAQPLPYFIHTCSKCGYTGSERDFGDEADVSPLIKEHVWDELAPKLPPGAMSGSDKYEFAAEGPVELYSQMSKVCQHLWSGTSRALAAEVLWHTRGRTFLAQSCKRPPQDASVSLVRIYRARPEITQR